MSDRDPKPENDPAISRAPTPNMPADELEDLLALSRLAAEHRQRAAIQANALAPRPPRGRR
jgi:hypothetical protein